MSDQGFLFGNPDVVEDHLALSQLRLLALNMQSPSRERATTQLGWLYPTGHNVLVLTEVKIGDGSAHLIKDLESSGYTVTRPDIEPGDRYITLVASKGYPAQLTPLAFASSRLTAARLTSHLGEIDIVGLYSLTNGMSPESSRDRAAYQAAVVDALRQRIAAEPEVPLLVTGDLNILADEPAPARALFAEHDFAFYRAFGELGLADAYRHTQPDGNDQTWYGPQGGQRLDHAFLSSALLGRLTECAIDHAARSRGISDHSALTLTLT